jgi:hypothetical protein
VSAVEPEARLRLLKELARKLPGEGWISVDLVWENEHGRAGVYTNDQGAAVFLNNAQKQIADLAEAEALLRAIFADEIVSVTGYEREQFIFCRLVPAKEIGRGIPAPDFHSYAQFKATDTLVVETWSRGMIKEDP